MAPAVSSRAPRVFTGVHSAGPAPNNCYSNYAQTNAQQLIDPLNSMDAGVAEERPGRGR
jgi:hypothetical protein